MRWCPVHARTLPASESGVGVTRHGFCARSRSCGLRNGSRQTFQIERFSFTDPAFVNQLLDQAVIDFHRNNANALPLPAPTFLPLCRSEGTLWCRSGHQLRHDVRAHEQPHPPAKGGGLNST